MGLGLPQYKMKIIYSRQSSCLTNLHGGLFLEPVAGPQHDLAAIHCKTVPQSQSSPSSTIPSPQKVESNFFRQETRWGASRLLVTNFLVQGDKIWWFNLWPSLENFDIRKRPFTHWNKRRKWPYKVLKSGIINSAINKISNVLSLEKNELELIKVHLKFSARAQASKIKEYSWKARKIASSKRDESVCKNLST